MTAENFKEEFNRIRILPKHYVQAEVRVEVTLAHPALADKEYTVEASGKFVRHREDYSLTIFFN